MSQRRQVMFLILQPKMENLDLKNRLTDQNKEKHDDSNLHFTKESSQTFTPGALVILNVT